MWASAISHRGALHSTGNRVDHDPVALFPSPHHDRLKATHEGVDPGLFQRESLPRIRQVVQRTLGHKGSPPRIGSAGQRFAREQLRPEALACYWAAALKEYGRLYYADLVKERAQQKQHQQEQDAAAEAAEEAAVEEDEKQALELERADVGQQDS